MREAPAGVIEQARRLRLDGQSPRYRATAWLSFNCGLPFHEVEQLRFTAADLDAGRLEVEGRTVELWSQTVEALRGWLHGRTAA